jgi:hypothetical protein
VELSAHKLKEVESAFSGIEVQGSGIPRLCRNWSADKRA